MNSIIAINRLMKSPRGVRALRAIREMMADGAISLDIGNQQAVLRVITAYWQAPASLRESVDHALSELPVITDSIPPFKCRLCPTRIHFDGICPDCENDAQACS